MERAQSLARQADEVHVVFNNNSRDFAPLDAGRLRRKLGQIWKQHIGQETQGDLLTLAGSGMEAPAPEANPIPAPKRRTQDEGVGGSKRGYSSDTRW